MDDDSSDISTSGPFPGLRAFVASAALGSGRVPEADGMDTHRADAVIDRAMDLLPARRADDAIQAAVALAGDPRADEVLAVAEGHLATLRAAGLGVAAAIAAARRAIRGEPADDGQGEDGEADGDPADGQGPRPADARRRRR